MMAIGVHGVMKEYGTLRALNGVSLDIPKGEFFGLLGPNGAGKTTLISCIVGLVRPTAGNVLVHGLDAWTHPLAAKRLIGFAPQETNVEIFFPIERILAFQGGYYGLSGEQSRQRAQELLQRFSLWDKRHDQYFRLSGGMKRRLTIVRALMGRPQILILDEPTAGVDVAQRHELWQVLRELRAEGVTIILTTHYIDEAESLCERVGIIDQGRIVELGSPQALIQKYCRRRLLIDLSQPIAAAELPPMPGRLEITNNGYGLIAHPQHDAEVGAMLEQLMPAIAQRADRRVRDMQICGGDLEEVFLKLTGRHLDAA